MYKKYSVRAWKKRYGSTFGGRVYWETGIQYL